MFPSMILENLSSTLKLKTSRMSVEGKLENILLHFLISQNDWILIFFKLMVSIEKRILEELFWNKV